MRLKLLPILLLSGVAALTACKPKQEETTPPPAAAATEDDKTLYAIGASLSENVQSFELTEQEQKAVIRGFSDGLAKKTFEVKPEEYQEQINALHQARSEKIAQRESEASKAYLEKAAAEAGAVKTDSGIVITEIKPGTGPNPKVTDEVKVNYRGTLIDGTEFDSSQSHGGPATFPLGRVVDCWKEGVQHIKVGGKSRLICPSNLAYGERGSPPLIKPGATLVFEVELLDIVK